MDIEKAYLTIFQNLGIVPMEILENNGQQLVARLKFQEIGYFDDDVTAQLFLTENFVNIAFIFRHIENTLENLTAVNAFNRESALLCGYIQDYGAFCGLAFRACLASAELTENMTAQFVRLAIEEFNSEGLKPILKQLTDATFD